MPSCPSCGNAGVQKLGAIPDVYEFAGQRLKEPLPGGLLFKCLYCELRFRNPILSSEIYDNLNAAPEVRHGTQSLSKLIIS